MIQSSKSRKNAYLLLLLLAGCHARQILPTIEQTNFKKMRVGEIEFIFPSTGKEITSGWENRQEKRRLVGSILVFREVGGSIGAIGNTYAFVYTGKGQCEPGSIGTPIKNTIERPPHKVHGSIRSVIACFDRNQELEIVVRSEPWPDDAGERVATFGDNVFEKIYQSMKRVEDEK